MHAGQHTIEIWKRIPGFAGYHVSNFGNVRSYHCKGYASKVVPWHTLAQVVDKQGYRMVTLYKDHSRYPLRVHTLVLFAFVGPLPSGLHACHNDDNKDNNRLDNLRYDTPASNTKDAIKNGRWHPMRGEAHLRAKVKELDVLEMRSMWSRGITCSSIAREFGMDQSQVSRIVHHQSWRWLP